MVLLIQLSEKRWVLSSICTNALHYIFNEEKLLRGLTVACTHHIRTSKISKAHPSPFWASNMKKDTKKIKICRSKFRFLCLDRKSCISWVEKVSPKPFATINFVIYAWFPKRHLIWGDSAKTRRKWWFYWSNSAKKGGFWALFSRNALHYIFNEENL